MKPKENRKRITLIEFITLTLSVIAIVISVLSFILPLIKSKLVIEDPSNVYFINTNNENYDEIIIPLICNNYGSFVRSVYKIEATINYENKVIPIRPFYEYEIMNKSSNELKQSLFSTFIINPNEGIKKNVGFKFDILNFSKPDSIPNIFHFEPNKTYVVNMRFYTTQNGFLGKKTEIIQVIYGFETKEIVEQNNNINVSKQTFFKTSNSQVFPY